MPFFRRKPFVIQARRIRDIEGEIKVETFNRTLIAKPGDWIIGDAGCQSVMSDRVFRELYEPLDDDAKRELED